jgi:iron-sulfur cluster assembly accessory protein
MSVNITFTDAACEYIKKMLEKNANQVFRLTVKKTGCSGYSYAPTLIDQEKPGDVKVDNPNHLNIFVDPSWLHILQGIRVDYVEEDKSGLKQKRLVFTNPNESTRCGCGESFHIEDKK